jgi:hypothetical protein
LGALERDDLNHLGNRDILLIEIILKQTLKQQQKNKLSGP